jgi:hypothetical protein
VYLSNPTQMYNSRVNPNGSSSFHQRWINIGLPTSANVPHSCMILIMGESESEGEGGSPWEHAVLYTQFFYKPKYGSKKKCSF